MRDSLYTERMNIMCQNVNLSDLLVLDVLRDDAVLSFLAAPEDEPTAKKYCISALIAAAETHGLSGNLLPRYLLHVLTSRANLVSETMERTDLPPGTSLRDVFYHDIRLLYPLLTAPTSIFLGETLLDNYEPTRNIYGKTEDFLLPGVAGASSPEEYAEILLAFYAKYGYGDLAAYAAFCWDIAENTLRGIIDFERPRMSDLVGYERQKEQLIHNTRSFVEGKPSNHVLLVGARGTGKSTAVKALAGMYDDMGLRLLQVTKDQLWLLPDIMAQLRRFASKKFIIFLDDLSFEDSDAEFKTVKSAIEGGVSSCPPNVRLYATSNRRHLVRETWRDRQQDELYRDDAMHETISLADRFGLIIQYHTPDQEEYLAIIDYLLRQKGIALTKEELHLAGLRWELTHSGRSGRTAQQFVAHYLGTH